VLAAKAELRYLIVPRYTAGGQYPLSFVVAQMCKCGQDHTMSSHTHVYTAYKRALTNRQSSEHQSGSAVRSTLRQRGG
jgi:hypothetical protein